MTVPEPFGLSHEQRMTKNERGEAQTRKSKSRSRKTSHRTADDQENVPYNYNSRAQHNHEPMSKHSIVSELNENYQELDPDILHEIQQAEMMAHASLQDHHVKGSNYNSDLIFQE